MEATAEPATEGSRESPITDLWRQPPGWEFNACLLLALLVGLWVFSTPVTDWDVLFAFLMVFLFAIWLARVGAYLFHITTRQRSPWLLVVSPALVLAFLLAVGANIPMAVRFAMSRDAFDSLVRDDPSKCSKASPCRVGLYTVDRSEPVGEGWLFQTGSAPIFTDGGFAFLPQGTADVYVHDLTHIDGPWWSYTYTD